MEGSGPRNSWCNIKREAMRERPRRDRSSEAIRRAVRETELSPAHLAQPFFVLDGTDNVEELPSLPGQHRYTVDRLLKPVERALDLGIERIVLFPVVPEHLKDSEASYGVSRKNFYLEAVRKVKEAYPELCVITDVAMDPYSSDGHDGILENGKVLNDRTLSILGQMALVQAEAGADMIGPSDMMDGRVGHIRDRLDEEGFNDTGIISYTAKYASALYGPFRDALDSAPGSGDKKSYQMDPANAREAIREAELDEREGADLLMVKPALHYLDVIHRIREWTRIPVAAYHVSGEYAMIKAAGEKGWLDADAAMDESLLSIRRAGADLILSYAAMEFAERYREAFGS